MKKLTFSLFFLGFFSLVPIVSAQGMMGQYFYGSQQSVNVAETAQDEAKGKAIWDQLQSKQTDCKNLRDDDFDVLGDYFMGLMMGSGHAAMNDRMTIMMGDQGEKQMHIVMGKRLSGCDTSAVLSPQYQGFSSFMPVMAGYNYQNYPTMNGFRTMMGPAGFPGFGFVGWVSLILFWTVLILAIAALAKYITHNKKK